MVLEAPAAMAQPQEPRVLDPFEPTVLDLRRPNEELRAHALKALQSITPVFCATHHGLDGPARAVIRRLASTDVDGESCVVFVLSEKAAPQEAHDLRCKMRSVAQRLASIVCGDGFSEGLEKRGQKLDGRLSLRVYPAAPDSDARLGAHLDANLFTLLWADAPGLEVLDPQTSEISAADVLAVGVPSVGPAASADFLDTDEAWAAIPHAIQGDSTLTFTVSRGWLRSDAIAEIADAEVLKVTSAALHRVRLDGSTKRCSIPYLVDVHPFGQTDF
ncbi:hypothetical protein M885DRAFT_586298 [Pelagophyceae sp. CCMP2097]|nr:hypothetical protein M885DRAFT_586298 [Pelagophyceae sp. CCMP2097]